MSKKTNKNNKQKQNNKDYGADNIEVLEGLEAVRKRPGMYIGGTGSKALHHMVYEVVDNSVDEALAGHCDTINIFLEKDGSVTVQDNGRGIPVGKHSKFNKSALEIIMTVLHSGGKFNKDNYAFSGGLHGVGLSVVNALSSKVIVTVKREGHIWELELERGEVKGSIKKVGKTKETGTQINFHPDGEIFETTLFNYDILVQRFKEMAFLNKGLTIVITDNREKKPISESFTFEGGIVQFIEELNKVKNTLHNEVIFFQGEKEGVIFECALQYTNDFTENIVSFANNIRTADGGTHEEGFKRALSRSLNDAARKKKILKAKDTNLTGDDLREGLTLVISIKVPEPQFEGQTKGKLVNTEVRGISDSIASENLTNYFLDHPTIVTKIVKKAKEAAKAREMARKSKEVNSKKNTVDIAGLSSKLAKCTSKNPDETELYIVEGDSAGGSAKQGRNRYFQAILPLRGKVINSEKARLSKILSNEEIKTMIATIGTGIGKDFDIENAKYKKIVIMTDADVDGEHIRTLLLTFFYRFMKPLIDEGYIYIAKPPLYKITQGKNVEYVFTENEKNKLLKEWKGKKVEIQRYKGLGEMDPKQLWETTMDPAHRVLIRVTETDAIVSDKIFTTLMGSGVDERREFIKRHAKYANIDYSNG